MSVTHFFNKDVKFKELQNLDVELIDNRQRAQDFGELSTRGTCIKTKP